jgi:hypothetical protein
VGVIMAASMRWDRNQKDFTAIESSLSIEDLTRLTGFSARALQGALKTAHEKGLIAVKEVPGRSSFYSIIPEQFKSGIKLACKTARKLNRETPEPRATKNTAKTAQAIVNTNVTPAVELHSEKAVYIAKEFGRCRNCGAFGPIEPVKPEVPAADIEIPQTRASPGPAETPQHTPKPEPPREQGREVSVRAFEAFWQMFVAAGKPLSSGDKQRAFREWRKYEADAARIQVWIGEQFAGPWRNEEYTPMPHNALASQGWKRVAAPRTLPGRMSSKREDLFEDRNEVLRLAEWFDEKV